MAGERSQGRRRQRQGSRQESETTESREAEPQELENGNSPSAIERIEGQIRDQMNQIKDLRELVCTYIANGPASTNTVNTERDPNVSNTTSNPSAEVASVQPAQATNTVLGPAAIPLVTMWKKGGTHEWATTSASQLYQEYSRVKSSHSALEDIFLDYESWVEELRVPPNLRFQVLLSYFPVRERPNIIQTYRAKHDVEDYPRLREVLLEETGERDPVCYYVMRLVQPPVAINRESPAVLRAFFNRTLLKLRRAMELTKAGKEMPISDTLLASFFLQLVPSDCRVQVRKEIKGTMNYKEAANAAVEWEKQERDRERRPYGTIKRDWKPIKNHRRPSPRSRSPSALRPRRTPRSRSPSAPARKSSLRASGSECRRSVEPHRRSTSRHATFSPSTAKAESSNQNPRGTFPYRPICYHCRQQGHVARDCPQGMNSQASSSRKDVTVNAMTSTVPISKSNEDTTTNTTTITPSTADNDSSTQAVAAEQVSSNVRATVRALPPIRVDQGGNIVSSLLLPVNEVEAGIARSTLRCPRRVYKILGTITWEDGSLLITQLLLDTGASPNVIRKDLVPKGVFIHPPGGLGFQAATNTLLNITGRVEAILTIGCFHRPVSLFVASTLNCPVILGADFISEYGISLSYEDNFMIFPEAKHRPVPFIGLKQEPNYCACYPKESMVLNPRTRALVEVIFPAKESKKATAFTLNSSAEPTYFIQATLHQSGLAVPNCLSAGVMEVINLSNKPFTIDTHIPLAWCYPIQPGSVSSMKNCLEALEKRLSSEQDEAIDNHASGDKESIFVNAVATNPTSKIPDLSEAERQLGREAAEQLKNLCLEYQDLFMDNSQGVTATTLMEVPVDTTEGVVICKPPYRQGKEQRETTRELVGKLLQQGTISKSTSPWASPICIVKKKDGSPRLCVDFREVNKYLSVPKYPLPRIDDVLQSFEGKKFFSVLDLTSGFWQIPIRKEDRHKTAFVTSEGLFEWNRLPFGLASSPAYFQRLMDLVIQGMKWTCAIAYIDDIIIFSETLAAHLQDLRQLFTALKAANLKLSPKKCVLGTAKVHYLGHVVSREGVQPDPSKIKAVKEYPQPKNVAELRRFLGLAQYYHRFIRNFSHVAAPLFSLLKKGASYDFNEECQEAFKQLKEALTTAPVLAHPDLDRTFIIECDASSAGYGACLIQPDGAGNERVIAYASRALTPTQRRWTATELEAGALIYALETFRTYVMGRKTIVRTDHSPLPWLKQHKDKSYKLTRWVLRLQEFDIDIVHKPGKKMPHVDALSRAPVGEKEQVETMEEDLDQFPDRVVLALLTFDRAGINHFVRLEDSSPYLQQTISYTSILRSDQPNLTQKEFIIGNILTTESPNEVAQPEEEPLLPRPPLYPHTEMQQAQADDPFCQKLKYYMKLPTSEQPTWIKRLEPFEMEGLLWVRVHAKSVLVLPKALQQKAIYHHHLAYYAGHFGVHKTVQRLKLSYYWPKMRLQVKAFISKCMSTTPSAPSA